MKKLHYLDNTQRELITALDEEENQTSADSETVAGESGESGESDSKWLRAYSGHAVLQDQNRFLKGTCFIMLALLLSTNFLWYRHSNILGEKQWIVIKNNGMEQTVQPATDFQMGPTDEEIKGRAWDVMRYMLAVNSKSIDKSYEEAKRLMTPQLQAEFETNFGPAWRQKLKNEGIYFKIVKVDPHLDPHQMSAKDLPPESKYKPTRFEVIITGDLEAYDEATNKRVDSRPFSYYLRMVPLQNRSVEFPSGILVDEMREYDVKHGDKSRLAEVLPAK
jgi:hypothetical protein